MRLIDAGMLAFAGWHALKGRVEWPLTFQVPRMLRSSLRDEGPDTYALFWNAERLRKRELWPDYRDRPEIWDEAGVEDFEAMLETLSALGAVQFRADGWEADEALAGDEADGIPGVVSPSTARELIGSRGHLAEWIDRDLRVGEPVKEAIASNRDQLRLNLRLVDLSQEAVGAPPAPLEAPGEPLERAGELGERTGVGWLQEPDLVDEYALLREWGDRTRERLEEVGFR